MDYSIPDTRISKTAYGAGYTANEKRVLIFVIFVSHDCHREPLRRGPANAGLHIL